MAAAYSEEIRSQVLAKLLEGKSLSSVARECNIGKATVIAWRNQAGLRPQPDLNGRALVGPEALAAIGEQVHGLLREYLTTLQSFAVQGRNPSFLKENNLTEFTRLHDSFANAAFQLLAALDPGAGSEPVEPTEPLDKVPA